MSITTCLFMLLRFLDWVIKPTSTIMPLARPLMKSSRSQVPREFLPLVSEMMMEGSFFLPNFRSILRPPQQDSCILAKIASRKITSVGEMKCGLQFVLTSESRLPRIPPRLPLFSLSLPISFRIHISSLFLRHNLFFFFVFFFFSVRQFALKELESDEINLAKLYTGQIGKLPKHGATQRYFPPSENPRPKNFSWETLKIIYIFL